MSLNLTITRHGGQLPAGGAMRRFDGDMVTIGRGDINDWVLPDPERLLSKRHCVIQLRAGRFSVMDTSTNGLFLNGRPEPLGRGAATVLNDGDRLALGDYEIEVRIAAGPDLAPEPEDPFAEFLHPGSDLAGPAQRGPAMTPPQEPVHGDRFQQPLADPWQSDPFFTPSDLPQARPFAREPLIPEDDDLFGPADSDSGWPQPTQDDHLPSHAQAFRPPAPAQIIPDDWESPIGGAQAETSAPPPTPESETVDDPVAAPPAVAPVTTPPQPATVRPPADAGGTEPALTAFLSGAGLEDMASEVQDPEAVLRAAGGLFRDMAEGLREILAARARIKNEFRVERTMIGAIDNNPLKFSPGGSEMLRLLLQPRPGYMAPSRAVRDGIEDVKAHEMAVMAGMQAAVDAVLAQLDPERLAARFEQQSVLAKLLPAARKARYWDLYEAQYRTMLKEIRDSFLGLFGREFARAYEEQTHKL